jgi:DNA primase
MQNLIDEIKARISITDIVNKLGLEIDRTNKVKSIYRSEKTASMQIYPAQNKFYDFGNGEHGDQIDLYMNFYNLDKSTALNDLKKIAGLENTSYWSKDTNREPAIEKQPVKEVDKALKDCSDDEKYFYEECLGIIEENNFIKDSTSIRANENKALRQLKIKRINNNTEVFEELYYYCLTHNDNKHYLNYLTEKRGLSRFGIENSKIFFIDNYNQVNNHIKKTFKNEPDKLKHSGLFNENGNMIFYNHRLIIPYQYKGKIVYLRGRYFDQENNTKTESNKYIGLINDSLGVSTPKRFFNIDVLDRMLPGQTIFLTEGELDCLLIEELNFYAMAIPGASNIPDFEQFKKLIGFKIIVVPDSDEAGSKLVDGRYKDKDSKERYSDRNLTAYFEKLKKEFYIKKLPAKDATDFLMGN